MKCTKANKDVTAAGEASASSVYATPTDVKEVLKKFQDTPENSAEGMSLLCSDCA